MSMIGSLDTNRLRDIRERFIFQGASPFALELADELDRLREKADAGANVIAVALGDGGHRLAEVGPRVAAEEAIAAISRLRIAVESEREACAKVCDEEAKVCGDQLEIDRQRCARLLATAIRLRGNP